MLPRSIHQVVSWFDGYWLGWGNKIPRQLIQQCFSSIGQQKLGGFWWCVQKLHHASTPRSHVEVVRRLLAARGDVEKEDTKKRWKPICFAAAAGNAQVMKALLEVQADVNDSEPFQLSQADDFASGLTHTHTWTPNGLIIYVYWTTCCRYIPLKNKYLCSCEQYVFS